MAAYNSKNLALKANSTNVVENTGVTLSAEAVSYNDSRPSEPDLMGKYLGIAKNQSCEIYTDLYYVINNNISGNLNVNLIDELYENNFNKEVDNWTTNINPINDYYYSVNNSTPSSLHEFTYHYGDYRRWQFDFQHKNMAFMNPDTDVNASVNAPVSEDAINQLKYYASKQKTEDNVGSIDEDAMSLGEWGTIYHYNITIKNAGKERTLIFGINTHDSKNIVRYSVNGVSDVKWFDVGSTNEPISIPITLEANSVTNIEFEYMLVYGAAGTGNFLLIE